MLHRIDVALGDRSYPILIGEGLLASRCEPLCELAQGRQVAIVTNPTVAARYLAPLRAQLEPLAAGLVEVQLPDGEQYKTWESLNRVFDALLAAHFDRRSLVVALGGGVIGDTAGFAAAVYQRGIDFVQVPTTLLAQVDSSVGGKTAVNHPAGKNMIGAFHQPRLVLADVGSLRSLPQREIAAGLAEMLKHGAIADTAYLEALERDMASLAACEPAAMIPAVARSCEIKAAVVAADEREGGLRAILNFGHTFGHAIEAGLGYGQWLHGEAVGAGMVMAAELSTRLGMLGADERDRLVAAIGAAGLPVAGPDWPVARYLELMRVDKKAEQGVPKFVLLEGLGTAVVRRAPEADVAASIAARIG